MKITIELTRDEVLDMLREAAPGCAYWARTNVAITRAADHPIAIYDAETNEKLGMLTPAKLRTLRLARSTPGSGVVAKSIALGYFDREHADVYVQLALFGEVRYG